MIVEATGIAYGLIAAGFFVYVRLQPSEEGEVSLAGDALVAFLWFPAMAMVALAILTDKMREAGV